MRKLTRNWMLGLAGLALGMLVAAGVTASEQGAGVEFASGVIDARRVASMDCTQTNHTGVPVDVHLGIMDPTGALLAGPVLCEDVPDGASCAVSLDVLFPIFDQAAWCHSAVSIDGEPDVTVAMRGNFVARDNRGRPQAEEDLRPAISQPILETRTCTRTLLREETRTRTVIIDGVPVTETYIVLVPYTVATICTDFHSAVVTGPRVGSLDCSVINTGSESILDVEISLHRPDGTLLSGPQVCGVLDPFRSCNLEQPVQYPDNELAAYCTARVFGDPKVAGNLTYEDSTHNSQTSSPLQRQHFDQFIGGGGGG